MGFDYDSSFGSGATLSRTIEKANSEDALFEVVRLIHDGGAFSRTHWRTVTVEWRTLTATGPGHELVVQGVGRYGTAAINTATILHLLLRRGELNGYLQRLMSAPPHAPVVFGIND